MVSAVAAFTWSAGAYSAEIIRASLGAVSEGQSEAAAAAGLSDGDAFRFVIAPQGLRLAVPPLMSLALPFFQFTSLAYAITVPEVMQTAYFPATVTFDHFDVCVAARLSYSVSTIPPTALGAGLGPRPPRPHPGYSCGPEKRSPRKLQWAWRCGPRAR